MVSIERSFDKELIKNCVPCFPDFIIVCNLQDRINETEKQREKEGGKTLQRDLVGGYKIIVLQNNFDL